MTFEKLNKYILHYIEDDKTKSAIMLTSPWGTGKSYYIQNELRPFLEDEKNGKHKCIVVSLYGLKDFFEVSKAIYVENRIKFLKRKITETKFIKLLKNTSIGEFVARHCKKFVVVKPIAKTVVRYVANHFNVDISCSNKDMKKLFESVNLSGKLVVLEDVERSGIDILDVMGYVNNLVEQDGVKVLLVVNEEEILKFEHEGKIIGFKEKQEIEEQRKVQKIMNLYNKDTEQEKEIEYSETIKEYLRIKEKTVSDTVNFEEDYQGAIKNIITMFGDETLSEFADEKELDSILHLMNDRKHPNLRSFMFACQKTCDIFKLLERKYLDDKKFVRAIFFGIIIFVQKQKVGKIEKWGQEKLFSIDLGSENAPLFKFCYEYVVNQIQDFSEVNEVHEEYRKHVEYDENKSNGDKDILTLSNYYIEKESDVFNALKSIENRLENPEDISFYQYGTIAVYSIVLKEVLSCDVTKIQEQLVKNLKGRGDKLHLEQLFHVVLSDECSKAQREEYEKLRKAMSESLNNCEIIIENFNYQPEQSKIFYNYAISNKSKLSVKGAFAKNLDIEKLAEMFEKGTAKQKNDIRGALLAVYRDDNVKLYFADDIESITKLLEIIKKWPSEKVGDRIQQRQHKWFIENLEDIIKKLS